MWGEGGGVWGEKEGRTEVRCEGVMNALQCTDPVLLTCQMQSYIHVRHTGIVQI